MKKKTEKELNYSDKSLSCQLPRKEMITTAERASFGQRLREAGAKQAISGGRNYNHLVHFENTAFLGAIYVFVYLYL